MSLMEILFGKKEKIDFKEIIKNGGAWNDLMHKIE